MAGLKSALQATVVQAKSLRTELEKAVAAQAKLGPVVDRISTSGGGSGGKGFVTNLRASDDGGAGLRSSGGF